jgi:hypothetical protein
MNARTLFKKLVKKPDPSLTLCISSKCLSPFPQIELPEDWVITQRSAYSYEFHNKKKDSSWIAVWYCTASSLNDYVLDYRQVGNRFEVWSILQHDCDCSWLTEQKGYFFNVLDYIQKHFWKNPLFHSHKIYNISNNITTRIHHNNLELTLKPYDNRQQRLNLASMLKKLVGTLKKQGVPCHVY